MMKHGRSSKICKTKAFLGSCAMKKTLYRIHPGISGDAVQSFFAIGRQEILPDFAVDKKM